MMEATTLTLLDAWHRGDPEALLELVQRHAPWLQAYAGRRMSPAMRRFETSEDVVQTVLLQLLRSTPPFRPQDEVQFRALIAKVVLNPLHDLHDYATSPKRDPDKTERLPSAVSHIGVRGGSSDSPARPLEAEERRGFVALALELVDPEVRRIIHLHDWEGLTFDEIGKRLELSEDAARLRYGRALRRLRDQRKRLEEGRLEDLARELEIGNKRPRRSIDPAGEATRRAGDLPRA